MIEIAITCSVFAFLLFLSFVTGLHYGSKVKNNETIDLPKLNPITIVKEHIEEKKAEEQQEKQALIEEINLQNIENYDGTGLGQRNFPESW